MSPPQSTPLTRFIAQQPEVVLRLLKRGRESREPFCAGVVEVMTGRHASARSQPTPAPPYPRPPRNASGTNSTFPCPPLRSASSTASQTSSKLNSLRIGV